MNKKNWQEVKLFFHLATFSKEIYSSFFPQKKNYQQSIESWSACLPVIPNVSI